MVQGKITARLQKNLIRSFAEMPAMTEERAFEPTQEQHSLPFTTDFELNINLRQTASF